jgi:ATP-binding cassette subfamily B protein
MRPDQRDPPKVERVFEISGRLRCSVFGLKGSASAAATLEAALREVSGVRNVEVSPVSGRVLVIYDDGLSGDYFYLLLVDISAKFLTASPAAHTRPPPTSTGSYLVGGIAAVVGGVALGSVTAGLTVGLAVLLGPPLWRQLQDPRPKEKGRRELRASDRRLPAGLEWPGWLKEIVVLARPHRESFVRAMLLSVGAAIAAVVRIASIAFGVDLLLGGSIALPFGVTLVGSAGVAILTGVALSMTVLHARLRHQSHVSWSKAGRRIQHDLRLILFDRVQRLEMSSLQVHQRGAMLATLVADIDKLEHTAEASWALTDLAISSTALLGAIGFIATTVPFWLTISVPVLAALSVSLYPKLRERYAAVRERSSQLAGQVSNQLDGLEIIKSFTAEDRELERLRAGSHAYLTESSSAVHMQSALPLVLEATILGSLVFTYRTNAMLTVAQGHSFGRFQALNMFTSHLMFPANTLGLHMDNLGQGLEALKRVRDALRLTDERDKDIGRRPLPLESVAGQVLYENVSFSYPGTGPVLRNVNMRFDAGATTAVVGLSGSGKTTLVRLLLRFSTDYSGTIRIDGEDAANFSRASLRQAIALVSQDVYLFDRSVMENIRLSRPDANEAEVIEASHLARAHEFISKLPNGYETKLAERGANLAMGERQRVSIARAILKNAPILILDEATSNLDSNTEADISRNLQKVAAKRTLILIAHRLATVQYADCIYVLEKGEVIAQGTHRELVRQPGRYQSLWQDQTGHR